jgi:hypothetical protein
MNNGAKTRKDFKKDLHKDLHSSCGWMLVLLLDKTEKTNMIVSLRWDSRENPIWMKGFKIIYSKATSHVIFAET